MIEFECQRIIPLTLSGDFQAGPIIESLLVRQADRLSFYSARCFHFENGPGSK